ncbi:related to SER3-3-phosphoglycerate dehydrogenase [Ramularia collo-cygni]|uniref:Related to SER3-3-phosphoglycerate dehydrogenase n=1 Tax=Ramularia collo-cygni TaxID=112498 RepID=A0A2D3UUZ0_9PEZI|nr:related to SER3-3-phosphoglycerate dehydrogenase [Ramularia collo-cygni]CZT19048.1 related to SER3-3-phosphoglycerate dehydrogenase [Ramularia collo-cygni]
MAPGRTHSPTPSEETANFRPKLYMIDKLHPAAVAHAQELFEVVLPTDPEIVNWQRNAEYLLVKSSSITSSQIAACTKLRAIGKQGVGLDKIDLEACAKANVRVFNTPGVNAGSVAELVLGLTMAVARQIGSIQVRQQAGELVHKETVSGQSVRGKRLALIGMGNISREVAKIFRSAFDAEIFAYDPFAPVDAWKDIAHVRVNKVTDALRGADILSVHVPLTEDTRNLIGLDEMRLLKPTSIVINAARGGIVSEEDLVVALEDGVIWGAGIDCHVEEPPSLATYGRLWSHPRVVSTPHIGAATSETQRDTAKAAIDYVHRFATT